MSQLEPLAIELLQNLGNAKPLRRHIDLMDSILGQITTQQTLAFDKRLTSREISCLYLAARGKTSVATARLLNISTSTVESHRKQIKRKLNCLNLTQAVFEGIRWGYLHPDPSSADLAKLPVLENYHDQG